MLKLTPDQLAATGCKTHEELAAALPALFAMKATVEGMEAKMQGLLTPLSEKLSSFEASLTSNTTEITNLKASAVDSAKAKTIAREEATLVMGAAAIPPQNAAPANPVPGTAVPKSEVQSLIAQGKFAEAYAASPEIQKEFSSADRFAAFSKNSGNVRTFTKN